MHLQQQIHFRECHVQDSKFKTLFLRNDAVHISKAHSTLKTFFIVNLFCIRYFPCSIDFSLSHDFNCICSFSLLLPPFSRLQQSAILMQMTTFYLCTIDCECITRERASAFATESDEDSMDSRWLTMCYLIIQLLFIPKLKRCHGKTASGSKRANSRDDLSFSVATAHHASHHRIMEKNWGLRFVELPPQLSLI